MVLMDMKGPHVTPFLEDSFCFSQPFAWPLTGTEDNVVDLRWCKNPRRSTTLQKNPLTRLTEGKTCAFI